MAGHSLRKEAMLYSEQMSNALTIHLRVYRRSPRVGTVPLFQRRRQLGDFRLLIDLSAGGWGR